MAKKKNWKKIIIITFWSLFLLGIGSIFLIFSLISNGKIGYLPPVEELQNPKNKFASEIYSGDMVVLGRYFRSQDNRVYVPYEELPSHLVEALIATEDARYYGHSGIDGKALLRVFFKTLILQQRAGGGSTISQQLAKLYYTKDVAQSRLERGLQKPIEWVIAAQLEKYYTKEEIVSMYFNQFDFLNNAVGIKSASQVYFNKSPENLNIEEAALLVGMCQNPSYYNPVKAKNYDRCRGRRNVVLDNMQKQGYITLEVSDSLKNLPMELDYQRVDHKLGLAPYFREYLRKIMTAKKPERSQFYSNQAFYEASLAWENDPLYGWCNKNQKPDGSNYNLYTDGLKIYTTIDSRMQQYAEESVKEYLGDYLQDLFFKEKSTKNSINRAPFSANTTKAQRDSIMVRAMRQTDRYRSLRNADVSADSIEKAFSTPVQMRVFSWKGTIDTVMTPRDSIRYYKHFLRTGVMSMDPFNGHVKAYVGGPEFNYFQYDMAMDGKRQVGSTIKPFLYAFAMEQGLSPCDEVPNVQPQIALPEGKIWTPRNVPYGESGKAEIGNMITLRRGLQTSNNWISAYLIDRFGAEGFVKLLHSFGIKNQGIEAVPALSLGIADFSVGEMVAAYTAFANKGIQTEPLFVTRIEDNEGNVVATFSPRMNEILSQATAEKMISMLQAVINGGTGIRLRSSGYSYHIKWETPLAGKTGTTQNNSDGWFIGFVPNLITGVWVGGEDRDVHFDNMRYGQGSASALPIFGKYMNKIYKDSDLGYSRTEPFEVENTYDCKKVEIAEPDAIEYNLFD
jgi:penicillin-binding protein 1A